MNPNQVLQEIESIASRVAQIRSEIQRDMKLDYSNLIAQCNMMPCSTPTELDSISDNMADNLRNIMRTHYTKLDRALTEFYGRHLPGLIRVAESIHCGVIPQVDFDRA